jgi:hypothetical protein
MKLRILLHDRDKKFAPQADGGFQSQGARVILSPVMAPRANAHAERWIGSCRRECLDWMLVVNQRHLESVIHEYCQHYNDDRPHRSRNLRPPASRGDQSHVAGVGSSGARALAVYLATTGGVSWPRDVIFEPIRRRTALRRSEHGAGRSYLPICRAHRRPTTVSSICSHGRLRTDTEIAIDALLSSGQTPAANC